jgi:hypothetical protein
MNLIGGLITVMVVNLSLTGCEDKEALGKASFGYDENAKASPASVISMGRDDEEGRAEKWHIGGGED